MSNLLTPGEIASFDEAAKEFLSKYEQVDGPKRAFYLEDDPYITIRNYRAQFPEKPEVIHLTMETAIVAWCMHMQEYLRNKTRIAWRFRPEADAQDNVFFFDAEDPAFSPNNPTFKARRQYKIYARLYAS